jgi:hypothetical protein
MGGRQMFVKINNLLEESGNPTRIESLVGLKSFINNNDNKKLPVYDQIEEMFNIIMVGQGMW